jgi:hypothetical protein
MDQMEQQLVLLLLEGAFFAVGTIVVFLLWVFRHFVSELAMLYMEMLFRLIREMFRLFKF